MTEQEQRVEIIEREPRNGLSSVANDSPVPAMVEMEEASEQPPDETALQPQPAASEPVHIESPPQQPEPDDETSATPLPEPTDDEPLADPSLQRVETVEQPETTANGVVEYDESAAPQPEEQAPTVDDAPHARTDAVTLDGDAQHDVPAEAAQPEPTLTEPSSDAVAVATAPTEQTEQTAEAAVFDDEAVAEVAEVAVSDDEDEAVVEAAEAAVSDDEDEAVAEAAEVAVSDDEDEAVAEAAEVAVSDDEAVAEAAEPAVSDDETGASFEPVDEKEDRPRRLKDLKVGMELEGRVTSVALYGVFVDVGVGRDGLVHISEMSDTRINSPSDLVQIGDTVNVRVKGIDVEARRISLSMRSPRERTSNGERNRNRNRRSEVNHELLADLSVGDMVEGTITGLAQFGAFVDIGVGKDGLVHISEMSEGHVDKPEDAVQVGDCHTFKILEVDPEGTRISLSLRRALRLQKMQQLEPGQELEGTVSGMAPFGAFVDIGVGRDGLVHISQLSEDRVGKVEDVVKVGDKITVRVLEVDSQSKRISLTMRPPEPEPEEGAEPAEEAAPTPPPAPREMRMPTPPAEGGSKRDGKRRGGRGPRTADQPPPKPPETYTTSDDDEEEFEGNATLEDLLTKFGGSSRKDRRRQNTEEEDDEEERQRRKQRQRDVIRRTLQQQNEDE